MLDTEMVEDNVRIVQGILRYRLAATHETSRKKTTQTVPGQASLIYKDWAVIISHNSVWLRQRRIGNNR